MLGGKSGGERGDSRGLKVKRALRTISKSLIVIDRPLFSNPTLSATSFELFVLHLSGSRPVYKQID